MAALTYLLADLNHRAENLRESVKEDHRKTECTHAGSIIIWDRLHPFSIIVHDKGASLMVNLYCRKCNKHLNRSEAL